MRGITIAMVLLLAGCGLTLDFEPPDDASRPAPSDGGAQRERTCDDGLDDDGDGDIDCADLDCAAADACPDGCDGVDEDLDGRIDERPPDGIPCASLEVDPERETIVVTLPAPPFDLHANLDTTGSMGPVLDRLQGQFPSSYATAHPIFDSAAFGFSSFGDFPLTPFGSVGDRPFALGSRVTTDVEAVRTALVEETLGFGSDVAESGVEALAQIATGRGVTWSDPGGSTGAVDPIDCAVGFDASLGHGTVGGACFREGSLRALVHITDAPSHDGPGYRAVYPSVAAADVGPTLAELSRLGVRIIGVATGTNIVAPSLDDPLLPLGMAVATGAVVPPCAFEGTAPRAEGTCAAGQCCTGHRGASEPARPIGCPLAFDGVAPDDVGYVSVVAIEALARFSTFEVSLELFDDPSDAVDARCFVDRVRIVDVTAASGCAPTPDAVDRDGDGEDDTVVDATIGAVVTWEIDLSAQDARDVDGDGDVAEACAPSGTYPLRGAVVANGLHVLAEQTRVVTVR